MKPRVLVTGGLGFVGLHVCKSLLRKGYEVHCYDKIDERTTNPINRDIFKREGAFNFTKGDILDIEKLKEAISNVDAIIHLAAISSVDRSIKNPKETLEINTNGTFNVLEAAKHAGTKRVHYVSTDEVFGAATSGAFKETSPQEPRNPYAAGKCSGDNLCQAWHNTYGIHVTITNSVNNYGPYQAPEKLIPRLMVRGIVGNTLPVYGDGNQVREWLYVQDHAEAIVAVLENGIAGERYCVGSGTTKRNIEIVQTIMDFLELDATAIEHVKDRKGHDPRYEISSCKLRELGWEPKWKFKEAIRETLKWYKANKTWWQYYQRYYPDLKKKAI